MTLILGIAHIIIAVVTIGVAIPLTSNKIPMNQTYGVRIPVAFESEEGWYKVNRYGGKCLIGWSIPVLLLGIALTVVHFKSPISPTNLPLVLLFTFSPLILLGSVPQVLHWAKSNVEPMSDVPKSEHDGGLNGLQP